MTTAKEMLTVWQAGHKTIERMIEKITPENIGFRVLPEMNSVGFLLRHIAESEIGISKTAFNGPGAEFQRKTVGPNITDTGEHIQVDEIKEMFANAGQAVEAAIANIKNEEWDEIVELRMGTYPRSAYVSWLASHSAYHAGQITLALKYGKSW